MVLSWCLCSGVEESRSLVDTSQAEEEMEEGDCDEAPDEEQFVQQQDNVISSR